MDQSQQSQAQTQQAPAPSLREAATQALEQAQAQGRYPAAPTFPAAAGSEQQASKEAPASAAEGGAQASKPAAAAAAAAAEPDAKAKVDAEAEERRKENANIAWGLRQKEAKLKEREAHLAQLEAREAKLKERESEFDELGRVDEIELLERVARKRGLSTEEVIRRAIMRMQNGGEATPDMKQSDLEREVAELKKSLAEREERDKRERETAQAAQEEAARTQAMNAYRADAASGVNSDKHPILAAMDADEVGQAALDVALQVVQRVNQVPGVDEVLDYLEQQESERFLKIAEARGYTKAEAQAALQAQIDAGQQPAAPAAPAKPVVSNKTAGQRGAAPPDYRNMTERERIKAAAAEVFGEKKK